MMTNFKNRWMARMLITLGTLAASVVATSDIESVQAQYANICPVTYEQVQAAILRAYQEDRLLSPDQLFKNRSRSIALLNQVKKIYLDPRCSNLRPRLEQNIALFWEHIIKAQYRAEEQSRSVQQIADSFRGLSSSSSQSDLRRREQDDLNEITIFFNRHR